ncbi:MAG TPA: hypothetical protein PLJ58_03410 [bacterium]|nr:hypothetical protein [bacterium]
MTNKNAFVLIISGIILLSAVILQIQRNFFAEPPLINNLPNFSTGTPSLVTTSTISNELSEEQQNKLKNYIKDNLSTLSPAPEVLGGKFYLTEFIINGPNTAQISYEDGHNSFDAEITYEIRENLAYLQNFIIISQNNQQYSSSTINTSTTPN